MDVPSSYRASRFFTSIRMIVFLSLLGTGLFANPGNSDQVFIVDIVVDQAPSCFDSNDGALVAQASGGISPYTYLWSDPASQTNAIATGLPEGNYGVTVFDQSGSFAINTTFFQAPDEMMLLFNEQPVCAGESNGSIDLEVMGGTPPFTYSWNNGLGAVEDPAGLNAGNYQVTVTDANNCTTLGGIILTELTNPISVSVVSSNISCFGVCDGTAEAIVNGGSGNYTYLWDDGATDFFQDGLCPGVHGVSVNDDNGCSFLFNFFTGFPPGFIVSATVDELECAGFDNASIDLSVAAASPPYSYLWNTGETTQDLSGLSAGFYTVTITDNVGCESIFSQNVSDPPSILATSVSQAPACPGINDGFIDLTVSGGLAPYTYLWQNGLGTDQDLSGLAAGDYDVLISDANSCSILETFNLSAAASLMINAVVVDVNCDGSQLGSIDISPSGGQSPYTFLWDNGNTTEDLSNLNGGQYALTLSDAAGCSINTFVDVIQPDLQIDGLQVIIPLSCEGNDNGVINAQVSGGQSPYTYSWNDPLGQTTSSITGLSAGTYSLSLIDASGCSQIESISLDEPELLVADVVDIQDVSCFGSQDAQATLSVSGGTMPYTYLWANGQSTSTVSNLSGGNQNVFVLDQNGCDQLINFFVFEPPPLIADAQIDQGIICSGDNSGALALNTSGGIPPYQYEWNNGQTEQNPVGLFAGNYSVTVEDQLGCKTNDAIQLQDPQPLIVSVGQITGVSCFGDSDGAAVAGVIGGNPLYNYLWDSGETDAQANQLDAGIHSVTITDMNACSVSNTVQITEPTELELELTTGGVICNSSNSGVVSSLPSGGTIPYTYLWSNGETDFEIEALGVGIYSLTVQDANACVQFESLEIEETEPIVLDISANWVTCSNNQDGTATASASGGQAPYTWLWDNGSTQNSSNGLSAGTHTCTIVDANGCEAVETFQIFSPAPLKIKSQSIDSVSCFGAASGQISVEIEGGTLPYTFQWSNGATTSSLNDLTSGIYEMTVMDANACSFGPVSIEVNQPDSPVSITVDPSEPTCSYSSDGSLSIQLTGGMPGYELNWSDGSSDTIVSDLAIGLYNLSVSDANDCVFEFEIQLEGPEPLASSFMIQDPTCFEDSDGRLLVDSSASQGGTMPYVYGLDGIFQPDPSFEGLASGNYELTIQDVNACEQVYPISIVEPPELILDLGLDQSIRLGESISLNPQVNTIEWLEYSWSPAEFLSCFDCPNPLVQPLRDIRYELLVRDLNGCSAQDDLLISVDPTRDFFVPNAFTPNGDGHNDLLVLYGGASVFQVRRFQLVNRWGVGVFQATNFSANDPTFGWDGTFKGENLPSGVYLYQIEVEFIDGFVQIWQGDITLVR